MVQRYLTVPKMKMAKKYVYFNENNFIISILEG